MRLGAVQLFVYVPPGRLCAGKFCFIYFFISPPPLTPDFPQLMIMTAPTEKRNTDGNEARRRRGGRVEQNPDV